MGKSWGSINNSNGRILLVTLVWLSIVLMVSGGYLGPRYGKRLPSGQRTIQSRSQARFYAGSRYGGKRSYWASQPQIASPPDGDGEQSSVSSSPYDCYLVPYIGVRCALRTEDGASSSGYSDAPFDIDYHNLSPSLLRTTFIGERGSGQQQQHGGGGGPSSAVQSVMGSEAK